MERRWGADRATLGSAAGIVLAFAVLATLPFAREDIGFTLFYLVLLTTILFWTAQATSWNVLSGYSGYFSFGQGAFVGLGAYTTAVLTARHDIDFFLTLPIAAGLSAVLAFAVGGLAFRLRSFRGEIFALLTLAVPFILASLARLNSSIDGGQGIIVPIPSYPEWIERPQDFFYLLNLIVAGLAVGFAFVVQHSRFGWALGAIRDAEDVAEGLGVATFRYKMQAIVASGSIGAVSGCIYGLQIGFVTVEAVFGLVIPLFVIVMSVLGGRTHWVGPVIGAAVIVILQDRLVTSGFEGWRLIILGAILAFLVVAAPEGLQARLRARPRATLGTFAVILAVLTVAGWGELLDQVGLAMLGTAIVALWPAAFVPARPWPGARLPTRVRDAPADTASVSDHVIAGPGLVTPADIAPDGAEPPALSASPVLCPPIVQCTDLSRYFGGVKALDSLTVEIREGELIGLVGPNGSGKTTLVNLLSGALKPTHGAIRVADQDIVGLPPHRIAHAGIARTYQIPRPFLSMTVRDNVAMAIMFGRRRSTLADARRAADEHLEFVRLAHRAEAYPSGINLHERQLLELARAIATRPRVLLLDEALAGLNPAEIDNAVEVVRRIHRSGITIVIVEHLLRVVNQLASRIIVLNRGTCLADGDPQTVMRQPTVVQAYLGKHAHA